MTENITPEVFQKLLSLAALEVPKKEKEYLRGELNNQMISVEILESIPIDAETDPADHGVPYTEENSPSPRSDQSRQDTHRKDILQQAPETEGDFIVVPDISHEEL